LLFEHADGDLLAHSQAIVIVREVMNACHVPTYGDVGGELVQFAF
jgi:hypothetical protein